MYNTIINFEGDIPGASPIECGNYSEQNLSMAKYYIKKYKNELVNNKRMVYPE
jgi:S-ribosylhomocysteine lyase